MSNPAAEKDEGPSTGKAVPRLLEAVAPPHAVELEPAAAALPTRRRLRKLLWAPQLAAAAYLAYASLGQDASLPTHVLAAGLYCAALALGLAVVRCRRSVAIAAGGNALGTAGATLAAGFAVSAIAFWAPGLDVTAGGLGRLLLGTGILLLAAHRLLEATGPPQRVLVVGRDGVDELLDALARRDRNDVAVDAVWSDGTAEILPAGRRREPMALAEALARRRPDVVVVAASRERPALFLQLADAAHHGFRVVELPEFYEHTFGRVPVRALSPAWFMGALHLYQRPYGGAVKRALDVLIAAFAIVLTLPAFAIAAALVATTGRPVIYRQSRLGEHGRTFTIFKFRSMRRDAEEAGAVWASCDDPRTTRVGRLLRRTRLDELPQLWNVLRGDMSIVGPRPERPEFLALLADEVPYWTKRQLLKPGVTGWAQICHTYSAGARETEEKLAYDLWYLRHRSLLVDVLICLRTLPRMLTGTGAR